MKGEAARDSTHVATACPGLDPQSNWDEPAQLRGELFHEEHLVAHARELARAHGRPSLQITPGPLRRRFAQARERIQQAYQLLAREVKGRRDPSPAEEWLLDNANIVEEQIREIAEDLPFGYLIELPRLSRGAMRGYPRVYALCIDYLRHTDARLDLSVLSAFVASYQRLERLTIGELWAVPIMLRLGLILSVGALAVSEANASDRSQADAWADRVLSVAASPSETAACLVELEKTRQSSSDAFLVQLLRRLREHDTPLELARDWIAARCAAMGTTPDELTRREYLRQAADQVSVGNAITSMRGVSAAEWDVFFERTSEVEAVLRRDPSGAFSRSDKPTRDRYRHVVEDLARRGKADEVSVARAALELAEAAKREGRRAVQSHIGFYLIDQGRGELERRVKYRPSIRARLVRSILGHPMMFYFGGLSLFSGALIVAAAEAWTDNLPLALFPVGLILFALLASEIGLALVNSLVVTILPPRLLPKLDFEQEIPDACRTLVVVPVLLDSEANAEQLIVDLEVRSLGNSDPNLYFALLTDFTDSDTETRPGDRELLELVESRVAALNARWGNGESRYWLLHRRRVYNSVEHCFMGWERKRGKLDELNRLLRGDVETSFARITPPLALLGGIRYVITLDADTELPRDSARKLVGVMAHPLNWPEVDLAQQCIVRGHAIVQPRVGTLPVSSRKSRFAAISTGPAGIDPYTTAASDTYQDLFGEGSFVGKGIYDVDAFRQVMAGRVPENRLLSHDLFEGIFARAALATDIEVLDEQPASYEVQVARQHRWVRGDWQLLPWILPQTPDLARRSDLRSLDVWKIFDNLRRSLLSPALVLVAVLSWFLGTSVAGAVAALVAGVFVVPLCARLILSVARPSASPSRLLVGSLGGDLRTNAPQVVLNLIFTLDQAWISIDAIARTLYRLFVSQRQLLEWTTMRQSQARAAAGVHARMLLASVGCVLTLALVAWASPETLAFALPFLLCWAAAPAVAWWLARPPKPARNRGEVSEADHQLLRATARKTWRFFDTFVTEADHFLPPDNYQEDPRGVVAHRTSPTNMGLYLLSVVSARDLGFIALQQTLDRLADSLSTLEKLDKREGHILNWYDTTTLRPLEPQYVSTVDSGNLAGYLWTLREACADFAHMPMVSPRTIETAEDAVRLARAENAKPPRPNPAVERPLSALEEGLRAARQALGSEHGITEGLHRASRLVTESLEVSLANGLNPESRYWIEQAQSTLREALLESRRLAPFLEVRLSSSVWSRPVLAELAQILRQLLGNADSPARIVALRTSATQIAEQLQAALGASGLSADEQAEAERELDASLTAIEQGAEACSALISGFGDVGKRASRLADAMNFSFLFDAQRELFSIGYNVSSARLDPSHYDLLASEARLCSLFSIAKGDVPQDHWFRLGRPRARLAGGRTLLSWSGSMFEYLMPLLVTRNNPDTLLDESYLAAIERQRKYAAEKGVPWGISESAYNIMDLRMTYQYRAFGVPGLGIKAGLGEDLVVAPYATVLAGLVRPDLVPPNLRELQKEGLDGRYGFYEAIDYTAEHVPPGRRGVVVKAFMAHHQGMTLVALDNMLNDALMQRRFHRDTRIKATELLLEERVPARSSAIQPAVAMPTATRSEPAADVVEHVGLRGAGPLRVHLLGHGELSSIVSATGAGVTTWKGLDVNRFREEPLLEAGGIYFYVRNLSAQRTWSAAYQPTRAEPSFYNVAFSIDRVEFHRRDGDVQTVTEIALSPEHAAEVRRMTLTNHGATALDLDVTSYTEVVLAGRGADVAHRAFSNLFVETEALPERGALIARRRPRGQGEAEVWMLQMLTPEGEGWSGLDFDTSRAHFLGRGGGTDAPHALRGAEPLSRQTGRVLDPALALRRGIRLEAGASARLTLVTALGSSRDEALGLIDTYSAQQSVARAIELGWAGVRVELRHLGISATEVHRFQRLLSSVIFPHPAMRTGGSGATTTTRGLGALWAHGISGDLPIVLCRIDHSEFMDLCRDLLNAHEFWRLNGFVSDLVIINDEPSGYLQQSQDSVRDLINQGQLDQRGGVFLRRADQMSEEERELVFSASRVVLHASQGSLARQLRRSATARPLPPPLPLPDVRQPSLPPPARAARPKLAFDNGFGGYANAGREYTVVLEPGVRTPAPWCNVMANPQFGTVVSEVGSAYTWYNNSQRLRLTPWSNDAVSDPSGELIYIRDDRDGSFWSPTPEPAGKDAHFIVSHGQGYTRFEHTGHGLAHELVVFVSSTDPVKFARLRIRNLEPTARRLSLFGVVEWVLGPNRESCRTGISSAFDIDRSALLAANPLSSFASQRAFFTVTRAVTSASADREEFFGVSSSRQAPEALGRTRLSGSVGAGLDPCAALHVALEVAPNASVEVAFVLGHAESLEVARALIEKYGQMPEVNQALERARHAWEDLLGAVRIKTPDAALDVLQNNWLLYQALSSRLWARTGFYQSSGAYGFRDQLQDVLCALHTRPEIAREHLLRSAARQFMEGDVQHWWHAETGEGLRTRCSDDMLWLPYAAAEYVRSTGDGAVLDELVPFLTERVLAPNEEDLFSSPPVSEFRASLYEHCVRALQVGTTTGPHGMATMRGGDWNDGMNRVGQHGQGESVWLSWFLARTLEDFSVLALARGDRGRAGWCAEEVSRLGQAVDEHAWDGQWYRRAYFDDGTPLGSHQNAECSIDAIAQSWAVIAGVGDPERAATALHASESRLISEEAKLMKLLDPPFEHQQPDPGYIRAYPPGIRENGGQYTHGVLWTLLALTLEHEGDRAGKLLSLLNPIHHGDTREAAERYRVEPYVVAADVYSSSEHSGRGGWTWYTGSAGWMYRIILENVLGVRRRGDTLTISPCIPSSWGSFEVTYRFGASKYQIFVDNPLNVSRGVVRLDVDGLPSAEGYVQLSDDGQIHEVRVTLGHGEVEAPASLGSARRLVR